LNQICHAVAPKFDTLLRQIHLIFNKNKDLAASFKIHVVARLACVNLFRHWQLVVIKWRHICEGMTCLVALLRMQAKGLIELAPSQHPRVRSRPQFLPTPASDSQEPTHKPVHEIPNLTQRLVTGASQSHLWNEYVARYHYLDYTPMSGSQVRYNVFAGEQLVACISFCACAWKLKARERFIGWSEEHPGSTVPSSKVRPVPMKSNT
jgi:hypothetical protein